MVEARVPLKAAQERLGHSRPDILLKIYACSRCVGGYGGRDAEWALRRRNFCSRDSPRG